MDENTINYKALYEQVIGENEELVRCLFDLRKKKDFPLTYIKKDFASLSSIDRYLLLAAICIVLMTISGIVRDMRQVYHE